MKNYFTVAELTASSTAKTYKINNTPTPEVEAHLKELITNILNPLREAWGSAITVSSGYRCPELNAKVGGVKTSAHTSGYAADLLPKNGKLKEFIAFCQKWAKESGIPFDQCINEYNRWVHFGYKNNQGLQRKQIFKM